jgi:hypothetical protein
VTTAREEIRELRQTIHAITGKVPRAGCTLAHLRRRLSMLSNDPDRARRLYGGQVVVDAETLTTTLSSVLGDARYAVVRSLAGGAVSVADVVRRAVDEYAVRQGRGVEVANYQRRKPR